MTVREMILVDLAHHLRFCTTCHDSAGGPLCRNGQRMWENAHLGPSPPPHEWAPYLAPCERDGTLTEFRPGPLVPTEQRN